MLPAKLDDVLLKALEKDRDLRYQTAAELRSDLKRLKRDTAGDAQAAVPGGGPVADALSRRHGQEHRAWRWSLVVPGALAVAAVIVFGIYALSTGRRESSSPPTSDRMTVRRLTSNRAVRGCGAISPDGKYVVYCTATHELLLHQVATGATVKLRDVRPEAQVRVTFSPDGNLVYVAVRDDTNPTGIAHSMPALGGAPQHVVTHIYGGVAVSPDGQRMAFLRPDNVKRETALILSSATDGAERTLATGAFDANSLAWPGVSWSADGRSLAGSELVSAGGIQMRPVVVDATTGVIRPVGGRTWAWVSTVAMLPDNAVVFGAAEPLSPLQLWLSNPPYGSATRITNDVNGLSFAGATADGLALATIQHDATADLWSTNADATTSLVRWTSSRQVGDSAPVSGARVYFTTVDGDESALWSLDRPGGQPRKLSRLPSQELAIPADGRFILFTAIQDHHLRIWRIEPDGSQPTVLTSGTEDMAPIVSADGSVAYYTGAEGVMRLSLSGGTPRRIANRNHIAYSLSADGRQLLVNNSPDAHTATTFAVLDAENGTVQRRLKIPGALSIVRWGQKPGTIVYAQRVDNVDNLWEQTVDGGASRQLTRFTGGEIFSFSYSGDGKHLFLTIGESSGNVVLIRDYR